MAAPTSLTMNRPDWLRLLALALVFGASFFFGAIAIKGWPTTGGNGMSPFSVVALRVLVAALTLFIVLKALRIPIPTGREAWLAFFGMGLLNNVLPFSLIFFGQSQMPVQVASGLASILNATTPLFTVVVAHLLTMDEKLTPLKLAGIVVGLIGVTAMVGLDLKSTLGVSPLGYAACLAAALIYGFAGLFGRRFKAMGIRPEQAAFGQVTASTIIMVLVLILIDQPWTRAMPGAVPIAAVILMGVISTALAYLLFFQILASAGATNLALVTFLVPVSSILLGVVILGERLGLHHLAGMGLIALGLACIDGRLFRKRSA
jgi:drug/metabolite transporter (DMT)-like permease